MNQLNSITPKTKYKHFNKETAEHIIIDFNIFLSSTTSVFRATHKNRHLKVPKRNIGKTEFLKSLSVKYGTTLSNIYNIINDSKCTVKGKDYKEITEYSVLHLIAKRYTPHVTNHSKLDKAAPFIELVINEVKQSKFNSIDETINDFKLNRQDKIKGLETISTSTMYNYIHAGKIKIKPIDLPRMLRRKPKDNYKDYTPKRQRGTSIDSRPKEVESRLEFGHWEGDLVTGPRDGENGAFLTLVERQTRFYYMIPIKNKKSKTVYMAINKLAKLYGESFKDIFKTITLDNGAEFSRYKDLEHKHKIKIYFAHPYHSYERGSNEIANQLIRYYVPKGTDINMLDKSFIKMIQLGINNKKRKILGYKSSEFFFKNQIANYNITNIYL